MALKSNLLDEKVVESAKETLKKVQNNIYAKELNAVITAKKHSITAAAKMLHFKNSIDYMNKALRFGREEKSSTSHQRRGKLD